MKKILFLIFMIFLLSGCSATYHLTIDDEKFIEKLSVENVTIDTTEKIFLPTNYNVEESEAFNRKIKGIDYYNVKMKDNNYSLSYEFNSKEFSYSRILNSCYKKIEALYNDGDYIISTVGDFNCFEYYNDLDHVQVKITSHYKLVDTNADEIDGHNYIWNINKSQPDKGIYIELDTKTTKKSILETKELLYIGGVVLLIGLIAFIVIKAKVNKNNNI